MVKKPVESEIRGNEPNKDRPLFLRSLSYPGHTSTDYPFSVETIASLRSIEFRAAVTFFAGENGSGKSTLLEAMALASDRVLIGGEDQRAALQPVRPLADALALAWSTGRTAAPTGLTRNRKSGFFLRAEDFLSYKRSLARQMSDLGRLAADYGERLEGYGRQLAQGTALGERDALRRRYGDDLDAMSHGESFLQFFRARFTGPGLYLLDEPDTALSPQSVLGLVAALMEMTSGVGAQFIIATHHPLLLAFPDAQVLSFDSAPIREVAWRELEQVRLMSDFLREPSVFLRHLNQRDQTEDD